MGSWRQRWCRSAWRHARLRFSRLFPSPCTGSAWNRIECNTNRQPIYMDSIQSASILIFSIRGLLLYLFSVSHHKSQMVEVEEVSLCWFYTFICVISVLLFFDYFLISHLRMSRNKIINLSYLHFFLLFSTIFFNFYFYFFLFSETSSVLRCYETNL